MSGRHTLTAERLAALAEIYGADPARWPEAEREAARRLTVGDAELLEVERNLQRGGTIDDIELDLSSGDS